MQSPVRTTRNDRVLSVKLTMATVKLLLVAPAILIQAVPFHSCHWYASGPLLDDAVTLNRAFVPAQVNLVAGCRLITGLTASFTVTVNEQVVVFPAASLAVYVIVVKPVPVVPFRLKVRVPTKFIPVAGEEATVAPVIVQVS